MPSMKNVRLNLTNSLATHNQYQLVGVYRYQLALTAPLQLAHGALSARQGLLLRFHALDQQQFNSTGDCWGEAAPLPGFSQESLTDIEQAVEHWRGGKLTYSQLPASLQFAMDMATLRLPDATELPAVAKLITANAQPQQLPAAAELKLAKLKLGGADVAADIQRFQALSKQFPTTRWRLDCNRQWTLEQARQFVDSVDWSQIEFIEEPCQQLSHSQTLGAQGVPVALDETLQQPDYQPHFFAGLAGLVVKPTLVGGMARLQHFADFCQRHDLPLVISGCFESNLGYDYLTRLASRYAPNVAPGLDTISCLAEDLIQPRSHQHDLPCQQLEQLDCLWAAL